MLERLQIEGLHGNKSIDVRIDDDTLILVGENGSGKTTVLRVLYYFLSGNWNSLAEIHFQNITLTINGEKYSVGHGDIVKHDPAIFQKFIDRVPPSARNKVTELIRMGRFDEVQDELLLLSRRYPASVRREMEASFAYLRNFIVHQGYDTDRGKITDERSDQLNITFHNVRDAIDAQILYLPTYRRIERELRYIYEGFDPDDIRRRNRSPRQNIENSESAESYIELVEFGMKDVEKAIKRTLDILREFARENLNSLTFQYLGDVVDKEYQNVEMSEIANVPEKTVAAALGRVDDRILRSDQKELLLKVVHSAKTEKKPSERSKIIAHYFLQLLRFQEKLQEKEEPISRFCALCSEYIVDKQFVYDSASINFSILSKDCNHSSDRLELQDLSSGEKQIVSLFSHLYLSGVSKFFVLIDEPELSLSVPWQKRFLVDVKNGEFCAGLVAVTHSPFIYDNELRKYAHSLGEFVSW